MSTSIKPQKAKIARAIRNLITSSLDGVSVVKYRGFQNLPADVDQIRKRLPGTVVSYAVGDWDQELNPPHRWESTFNATVLFDLEAAEDECFEMWLDRLEVLFDQPGHALPGYAEGGVTFEYCRPLSDGVFEDLMEYGIAGVTLTLAVAYSVIPTADPEPEPGP